MPAPDKCGSACARSGSIHPTGKTAGGDARDSTPVPLPSGVGFEASGVVDEVGPGVAHVSVGDAVFGFGANTVAEYAVLHTGLTSRRTFRSKLLAACL